MPWRIQDADTLGNEIICHAEPAAAVNSFGAGKPLMRSKDDLYR